MKGKFVGMNLKSKYLIIILAVIIIKINFSINVKAEEYSRFNNISIEDGLSQATVETMMHRTRLFLITHGDFLVQ